jgi:hypothetical protein
MTRLLTALALPALLATGCVEKETGVEEIPAADIGDGESADDRMGESCDEPLAAVSCGDSGVQYCSRVSGVFEWGPCLDSVECMPGQWEDCDEEGRKMCSADGGVPFWDEGRCEPFSDGGGTPLVLTFDGAEIRYATGAAPFDIDGSCVAYDFPTADTPWLAVDLDGDGVIHSGRELFGSGTVLPDGNQATNGFEALAPFDSNGDGWVTVEDERYRDLVAWADVDGDRVGTLDELTPIAQLGVSGIPVDFSIDPVCDARGNCGIERASMQLNRLSTGTTAEVVDVHLPCR